MVPNQKCFSIHLGSGKSVNIEMQCSFETFTSCHQLNHLHVFPHARDDLIGYGSELSLGAQ